MQLKLNFLCLLLTPPPPPTAFTLRSGEPPALTVESPPVEDCISKAASQAYSSDPLLFVYIQQAIFCICNATFHKGAPQKTLFLITTI